MEYGYRLFEVALFKGENYRRKVRFEACQSGAETLHYAQVIEQQLSALQGRRLIGKPKLRGAEVAEEVPDGEGVRTDLYGEPQLRVVRAERRGTLVYGLLRRGVYGTHDVAMGSADDEPDVPLKGKAPSRGYRFVLNLPAAGETGVLAVEDVSRACPADLLNAWLRKQGREDGAPLGHPGWSPRFRQMADEEHLRTLLRAGAFGEVRLKKYEWSAGRTRRGSLKYRITAPRVVEGRLDELVKVVASWVGDEQKTAEDGAVEAPATQAQAAQQLARVVDPTELGQIDFDAGEIAISAPGAKSISFGNVRNLFVYQQAGSTDVSAAGGVSFYRDISSTARRLLGPESDGNEVTWPGNLDVGEAY